MPELDLTEKIADWIECMSCLGNGCRECNFQGWRRIERDRK